MPSPDGVLSVALDFDGSLVEGDPGGPLRWRRSAREFIVAAAGAGIRLYLHSCRCVPVGVRELPGDADEFWRTGRVPADAETSWALREQMEAFLRAEGVRHLVEPWDAPGKPLADFYPDDKGERPDWVVLAGELGVRLAYGVRPPELGSMGAPAAPGGVAPVVGAGAAPGG